MLAAGSSTPAGFKHFVSSKYPYSLDYPAAWKIGSFLYAGVDYDTFRGPVTKGKYGPFQTNVTILSEHIPSQATLDAYAQAVKQANASAGAIVIARSKTRIAGLPAWLLKGHLQRLRHNDFQSVVFITRGHGWQITLSADPTVLTGFLGAFHILLASFRLRH